MSRGLYNYIFSIHKIKLSFGTMLVQILNILTKRSRVSVSAQFDANDAAIASLQSWPTLSKVSVLSSTYMLVLLLQTAPLFFSIILTYYLNIFHILYIRLLI